MYMYNVHMYTMHVTVISGLRYRGTRARRPPIMRPEFESWAMAIGSLSYHEGISPPGFPSLKTKQNETKRNKTKQNKNQAPSISRCAP